MLANSIRLTLNTPLSAELGTNCKQAFVCTSRFSLHANFACSTTKNNQIFLHAIDAISVIAQTELFKLSLCYRSKRQNQSTNLSILIRHYCCRLSGPTISRTNTVDFLLWARVPLMAMRLELVSGPFQFRLWATSPVLPSTKVRTCSSVRKYEIEPVTV